MDKTPSQIFAEQLLSYQLKHAEAEARKSPEQKADEKRHNDALKLAAQQEKAEKESKKLTQLYSNWCKRDTWLVYEQAVYLADGRDPAAFNLVGSNNTQIWELTKSCGGHSLSLVNPKDKPSQWMVSPREWARWLKEKGYSVPVELTAILFPEQPIVTSKQKIAPAQESREKKKRDRLKALKAFVSDVEERARKSRVEFVKVAISVTKGDFLDVFYSQYPQYEKISLTTFEHDIAEIGLKFKSGSKSNKNNQLSKLFT